VRFRHNTVDEKWLEVVGEKKWIVLTRDKMIGHRLTELDALLYAGTKAFVLVTDELTDAQNVEIIKRLMPKILDMITENHGAFIAKIRRDTVVLWKTKPKIHKGIQRKRRKK
jgi:PIN domain-containing protein